MPARNPWTRTLLRLRRPTAYLGTLAALTIAAMFNLIGIRFDRRWDLTPDHRYTPSPSLQAILKGLHDEVTVTVLLARTDPLAITVDQMLSSYRAQARHLSLDWVDPDREPARFLSKQSELGLVAGRTEEDNVTSDAILVVSRQGKRYAVEAREFVNLDPDAGESTEHFERAFTIALRTVLEQASPTVCFTDGHRELSTSDQSPLGLSRFKQRLEHEAMTTKVIDLARGERDPLLGCELVIVAAPDVALVPHAVTKLTEAAKRASLLLLGGVVPDTEGKLSSVGFEPLAQLIGVRLGLNVVVELDDAFRLPNLFGETFLATPAEHASTHGLVRRQGESPLRVVVSLAQSLEKEAESRANTLLSSSPASIVLPDVSQASLERVTQGDRTHARSFTVAVAGVVGSATAGVEEHRLAITPANVFQNRSFENPSLLVTRSFGLSLVSWLLARKSIVVEPEARPMRPAGFELSAEDLAGIARYTMLIMPGCFLLLGASILWYRRRPPQRGPSGAKAE
ncbi:MAG TPA: Gldg family protein [Polyangiaceae bacterium]|nr:Gldg family protein [Polyangiaceae bacterium]